jgi:hypothetical protein
MAQLSSCIYLEGKYKVPALSYLTLGTVSKDTLTDFWVKVNAWNHTEPCSPTLTNQACSLHTHFPIGTKPRKNGTWGLL